MSQGDDLGDRMKAHEAVETDRRLNPHLPIYARIDGRRFSRFTRGMARPFDERMSEAMLAVAERLVLETHAVIGYVQSDEISLIYEEPDPLGDVIFGGRVQKMTSVLASMAAAEMAVAIRGWEPYCDRRPAFDARVLQLPSRVEAANMLLWRSLDATKNAISAAAQAHFSHNRLHGKKQADMLAMLGEAGVDFDDYPAWFRFGVFVRRTAIERELTADELARIPERHRPTGPVMRSAVQRNAFALRDVTDRVAFIFREGDA